MKKYFHLLFILFSVTLNAQLKVGVQGGLNHANIHRELTKNSKLTPGFSIGTIFQIPIGDTRMSLNTGASYARLITDDIALNPVFISNYNIQEQTSQGIFNALNVPLFFRINPTRKFSFFVGEQLVWLFDYKYSISIDPLSIINNTYEYPYNYIKSLHLAFASGIDFQLTNESMIGLKLTRTHGDFTKDWSDGEEMFAGISKNYASNKKEILMSLELNITYWLP